MSASSSLILMLAIGTSFSQTRPPQTPLTVERVNEVYANDPDRAAEILAPEYKQYVEETYRKLAQSQAPEQELVDGLKEHDAVFHRLISLAVAQGQKAAKISASWALNGRAIAPQVIAERNRGGQTQKAHYVTLEKVREKLPANSVLIEIILYNRYDFRNNASLGRHYAAWAILPNESSNVVLVALGADKDLDTKVEALKKQIKAAEEIARGGINDIHLNREEDGYVKKWNASLLEIRKATLDVIDKEAQGQVYKGKKHWILGPAADLWLVPFAALPMSEQSNDDANGIKYAVEDHEITYVVTGRDLIDYGVELSDSRTNALIMGAPNFDGTAKAAAPARRIFVPSRLSALAGSLERSLFSSNEDHFSIGAVVDDAAGVQSEASGSPILDWCVPRSCCVPALIVVHCSPNAKVFFDGIPTYSSGPIRRYSTAPLAIDKNYQYQIKSEVVDGGKPVSIVKDIEFRGDQVVHVNLAPSKEPRGFLLGKLKEGFDDVPELADIAKGLKNKLGAKKDPLLGDDAQEIAFYPFFSENRVQSRPNTLIFCTHGFFEETTPGKNDPLAMCGLALTGANKMKEKEIPNKPSYDGLLTGLEIAGTNLQGVDLVVTIACQTSQGKVIRGLDGVDGGSIASLRHAFRLAGARTVVATLWPVDVEPGQVMIAGDDKAKVSAFFDNLIAKRWKDKGKALNEAEKTTIAYLRANKKKVAHPYYWAGFSLTGDWGVLTKDR